MNIGAETLRALRAEGHEARAFDLDTPAARETARTFDGDVEIVWDDVTDAACVARAVAGCDAVIHDAAIIPPASDAHPERARHVNVEGTRVLVAACEALAPSPRFVFASSVSLHGWSADREPPVRAADPIHCTDVYTETKAACEEMLRKSSLDWVILRFGAVVPSAMPRRGDLDVAQLFVVDPDARMEYVHPADAALAQARAIDCAEARHAVLMIGGGEHCQVRLGDIANTYLEAAGIGPFPRSAYGDAPYYTDWMDTDESQRLLGYQRHDFAGFQRDVHAQLARVRPWLRLVRGPIRWWMLRQVALGRD